MSSIKNILLAPFSMARTFFEMRIEFGNCIAALKALEIFVYHFPSTRMFKKFYEKMNDAIYGYLVKDLSAEIKDYCASEHSFQEEITPIIWQSWWQGEDCLDDITKICTESVKRNSAGFKRVFVTKDNYKEYVHIPHQIFDWLKQGRISYTHFSDYLRMALLCQKGGVWLDCTLFLSQNIDLSILQNPFYSTKAECEDVRYISRDIWSTFCLGAAPGFPMMEMYLKLYVAYFSKHSRLIDYYLTDFLMRIAYENIKDVKDFVDAVPVNNTMKHSLTAIINERYNKEYMESVFENTTVFKLSRKMPVRVSTSTGEITLYGKLLEETQL